MPNFTKIQPPTDGTPITYANQAFTIPNDPIIPFIEGDGTGRDIWKASKRVFDAAVAKVFGGDKKIAWFEIFAGEKCFERFGEWIIEDTFEAIRAYKIAIKGPLTTPIGGGIRSLNVTLRQVLDLYACVRPVYHFEGVPSPVRRPEDMNVVIFRENTEDVYAGLEWKQGTPAAAQLIEYLNGTIIPAAPDTKGKTIRADSGIGVKPISITCSKRLVRQAIQYALKHKLPTVTLMHKGNIMKWTEGAFKNWGYEVAAAEFRGETVSERESWILGNKEHDANLSPEANARQIDPGFAQMSPEDQKAIVAEVEAALALWPTHGEGKWKDKLLIQDRIADSIFQQVLTRTTDYDVIATPNLDGDFISDACAAQIGGLGVAPGANIGDGLGLFEATHGTAPKYADKDVINPSSVILSGCMMFEHMGWTAVSEAIKQAIQKTIRDDKTVTYDIHRLMAKDGIEATKVKCSEYATAIIKNL